jgi:LmbE family N-acetylglucosaminyl deacetylase
VKTLIVAAHPDDEVLGCGGTASRLAKEGNEVHIAILGEGIASRHKNRDNSTQQAIDSLREQARKAAQVLGIKEIFFRDLPDNSFDTVPLLEVVRTVESHIMQLKPDVIYTHHSGDLNIDHAIVNRAVLTATRPQEEQPVKEVYAFEVPSSTDWSFGRLADRFQPNVFVDISETLDAKIEAFSRYETEIREFPHPRSPEAVRAAAQRWGSVAGCEAAEAFELLRSIH